MDIPKIALFTIALLLPLSMQAQKKKKVVKKQPVTVVEEPQEDPRITEMREVTQQIVFIDSIVTDKADFLSAIRLSPESGQLFSFNQFFHKEDHHGLYVYLNEMGNKCYFSDQDNSGQAHLYTSDKLGKEWSEPVALKGISDGITETNYPFMMTDGMTFYFAAKGEESIGGYDIFMTRYDSESGRFLKPENIGMPFNSEANDYMYAIDEQNDIGYFVTDRRQPEEKVCVYIFIPPSSRHTYNLDTYSKERIRSFADINRIADTWNDSKELQAAIERLKAINTTNTDAKPKSVMHFVVNDQVVYTAMNQFRSSESKELYREFLTTQKQQKEVEQQLEKLRRFYAKANSTDRQALREEILEAEKQMERLSIDVLALEKRIRNAENIIINP